MGRMAAIVKVAPDCEPGQHGPIPHLSLVGKAAQLGVHEPDGASRAKPRSGWSGPTPHVCSPFRATPVTPSNHPPNQSVAMVGYGLLEPHTRGAYLISHPGMADLGVMAGTSSSRRRGWGRGRGLGRAPCVLMLRPTTPASRVGGKTRVCKTRRLPHRVKRPHGERQRPVFRFGEGAPGAGCEGGRDDALGLGAVPLPRPAR
jgi:hypothetical protein